MKESATSGPTERAWKTARHALAIAEGVQSAILATGAAKTVMNSAAVPAGNPIFTPPAADFGAAMAPSPSGKFKVSVAGFFRATGPTVDTAYVVQIVQDPGGANTLIGPAITVDSSHVNANGAYAIPEIITTPAPGSVLIWAARISSAATNAEILAADETSVTVTPLAA